MLAPRYLRASTSTLIGLCFMRSVPVSICSPGVTDRYAVINRIAVPAALMSIS